MKKRMLEMDIKNQGSLEFLLTGKVIGNRRFLIEKPAEWLLEMDEKPAGGFL